MPDHSFSKEIFPNIKSKPSLVQPEAFASRLIDSYLAEETNTCLTITSFQVVVESEKVPPQPPVLLVLLWHKSTEMNMHKNTNTAKVCSSLIFIYFK